MLYNDSVWKLLVRKNLGNIVEAGFTTVFVFARVCEYALQLCTTTTTTSITTITIATT